MEDKLEFEVVGVPMLCYVDSAKITNEFFLEYKTGKEPWDQDRVDEHEQLDWYALGYWLHSSDNVDERVIPSCQLVWVETEDVEVEDGGTVYTEVRFTGRVEIFDRNFTVSELIKMEGKIIKALKEIDDFEYVEAELDEDLVVDYMEYKATADHCKSMMDEIKDNVMNLMNLDSVSYASSDRGKFTRVEKNNYIYSDCLKQIESEFKKAIAKLKKYEVANGIAKQNTTKYLTFKEF